MRVCFGLDGVSRLNLVSSEVGSRSYLRTFALECGRPHDTIEVVALRLAREVRRGCYG